MTCVCALICVCGCVKLPFLSCKSAILKNACFANNSNCSSKKRKAQKNVPKVQKVQQKSINLEKKTTKVQKNTVNWQLHRKQKESGENKSEISNTRKRGHLSSLAQKKVYK